jgi:hypothetical protein
MNWLAVLSALAKLVLVILEMARERQAQGTERAEAIAGPASHVLDLIRKARATRRIAADTAADPSRLRDDAYRRINAVVYSAADEFRARTAGTRLGSPSRERPIEIWIPALSRVPMKARLVNWLPLGHVFCWTPCQLQIILQS